AGEGLGGQDAAVVLQGIGNRHVGTGEDQSRERQRIACPGGLAGAEGAEVERRGGGLQGGAGPGVGGEAGGGGRGQVRPRQFGQHAVGAGGAAAKACDRAVAGQGQYLVQLAATAGQVGPANTLVGVLGRPAVQDDLAALGDRGGGFVVADGADGEQVP